MSQAMTASAPQADGRTENILEFAGACTGAPDDWPHKSMVLRSVVAGLDSAAEQYPSLNLPQLSQIRAIVESGGASDHVGRDLLRGRTKHHSVYSLLIHMDEPRRTKNIAVEQLANQIVGNWLLTRYLSGKEPKPSSCNLIRSALFAPGSNEYVTALERSLRRARTALNDAISDHPGRATSIGLASHDEARASIPRTLDDQLASILFCMDCFALKKFY